MRGRGEGRWTANIRDGGEMKRQVGSAASPCSVGMKGGSCRGEGGGELRGFWEQSKGFSAATGLCFTAASPLPSLQGC